MAHEPFEPATVPTSTDPVASARKAGLPLSPGQTDCVAVVVVENVMPKLLRSDSDLNGRSMARGIRL